MRGEEWREGWNRAPWERGVRVQDEREWEWCFKTEERKKKKKKKKKEKKKKKKGVDEREGTKEGGKKRDVRALTTEEDALFTYPSALFIYWRVGSWWGTSSIRQRALRKINSCLKFSSVLGSITKSCQVFRSVIPPHRVSAWRNFRAD